MIKQFGVLLIGDVFISNGEAWQKLIDGRAYCPSESTDAVFSPLVRVYYVGMGFWPSEELMQAVRGIVMTDDKKKLTKQDLLIDFYVWVQEDANITADEIFEFRDGDLRWADTISGYTPETVVNEYIAKTDYDEREIALGDDEVAVWIRPVSDPRFGLRKYMVTGETSFSYTSERVIELVV